MAEQLPEGTDTIIEGAGVTHDAPDLDAAFTTEGAEDKTSGPGGDATGPAATGAFFDRIEAFRSQGYDKARDYAVQGKDKATGALDELLRVINDAAGQVDDKVGSQYGDYARKAAESLGGFNEALKGKDVDELFNDARAMIAKAPAIAVGAAAAIGFVIARLAKAGLDDAQSVGTTSADTKSADTKPSTKA